MLAGDLAAHIPEGRTNPYLNKGRKDRHPQEIKDIEVDQVRLAGGSTGKAEAKVTVQGERGETMTQPLKIRNYLSPTFREK